MAARDKTVYGLLSHSVFSVDAPTGRPIKLTSLPQPASAGLVVRNGHLYYAVGAQLCRYQV